MICCREKTMICCSHRIDELVEANKENMEEMEALVMIPCHVDKECKYFNKTDSPHSLSQSAITISGDASITINPGGYIRFGKKEKNK